MPTIPQNVHAAMLRHGLEQKPNEWCSLQGANAAQEAALAARSILIHY
jgi:hypothetical protein